MNSPETEYKIISTQDITEVDIAKLTDLINDSFQDKTLIENYFDKEKEDIKEIFYVISNEESPENYLGAAIIEDIEDFDNIFYIDKFVVEKSYQGNGLGTALWNAITDKYKKLIWRASLDNPAKDFYEGKYDDMKEKNAWNIYYKGLNDVEDNIDELIDTVAKKEATMIKT